MPRAPSVDVVRGFAILWMVLFETLDIFSSEFDLWNRYWYAFGFDIINWVSLFMLVAGVGIKLSVDSQLKKGKGKIGTFVRGLRRYLFYLGLSLFLCLWVADIGLFLSLGEFPGAFSIYAIITLVLVLIVENHTSVLLILTYGISFFLQEYVSYFLIGLKISPFFYGFTVWNILPFMITGVYVAHMIDQSNKKSMLKLFAALLPVALVLLFLGDFPSYFNGTISYAVDDILIIVALFVSLLVLLPRLPQASRFFGFFGRYSIVFYVAHVALWYKLLLILDKVKTFDLAQSILLTLASIAVSTIFILFWRKLGRARVVSRATGHIK